MIVPCAAREPDVNLSANHRFLTPWRLALRRVGQRCWLTGQQRRRRIPGAGLQRIRR
jgi:hypothetical protein